MIDATDELNEQLDESGIDMPPKVTQKPWNEVVVLRPELLSGEVTKNTLAADLQDVLTGDARPLYQNATEFFSFTYPTFNLRELAKNVVWRLAGKNEKAIQQLTLTYGGGKTHTLLTLYHLVNNPGELPDLPTVQEFLNHMQMRPPKTQVAVLSFDKIDTLSGRVAISPTGERRELIYPWSLLAYELAGDDGLRILNRAGDGAERDTPPAENLLVELLAVPKRKGKAVLILMDEVLMYARVKVGKQPEWRAYLNAFFQYLTQAVEKVNGCALVASLLATELEGDDEAARGLLMEYSNIFRRMQEATIEPVEKEDIAEVMRRRFFTPDSIRDRSQFTTQAQAALQNIAALDKEHTGKDLQAQERRYIQSYPFHPDLTDLFYTKWTQLGTFQRTRGILRIFVQALKDAYAWDQNPLIATNVLLAEPNQSGISEAARELAEMAERDETAGQQAWGAILGEELEKAKAVQREFPALTDYREIEQAVVATFLHSQPLRAASEAKTHELLALTGQMRPDSIDLSNALRQWAEHSWFLDEKNLEAGRVEGGKLPASWRLGLRPNLKQVHHTACERVTDHDVEIRLLKEIENCASLRSNLPAGVKDYILSEGPRDIPDDGEFHYAVLGPAFASRPGAPSLRAQRLIEQKTGPGNPRVNRNAVILAVPSFEGLAAAQYATRQLLGWLQVDDMLKGTEIDPIRKARLAEEKRTATKKVQDLVRLAYTVFITLTDDGDKGTISALSIVASQEPLFQLIMKNKHDVSILEKPVTAGALLPDGPYDLWKEGDTARLFKHLVEAFAQVPHLPKMLNRKAIEETLLQGGKNGLFVFRRMRPDHTYQTFWREIPDDIALKDAGLEVALSEFAPLDSLSTQQLEPCVLPGLWQGDTLTLAALYAYFANGRQVKETPAGYSYEIEFTIPHADRTVLNRAVKEAVREKRLWLLAGNGSFFGEDVPLGLLTEDAYLTRPPDHLNYKEILPEKLPEAWTNGETTAWAIAEALATAKGRPQPWSIVREAIDTAKLAHVLDTTPDSLWPSDYANARQVKIVLPVEKGPPTSGGTPIGEGALSTPPTPQPPLHVVREQPSRSWTAGAYFNLNTIQDLYDRLGELEKQAVGQQLALYVRIELSGKDNQPVPAETVENINALLSEVSEQLKLQ